MSKYKENLQEFANELIKQIEANEAPWQKGWAVGEGDILPVNHQGKTYRGGNLIKLMNVAYARGYKDNRWFTYNNAQENGGQVRKGEKGTLIHFFSRTKTETKKDEQGNVIRDEQGKPAKVTHVLDRPIITTAVVFNADQIDGLPPRELKTPLSEWERHEKAEAIAEGIQRQGVTLDHIYGDQAFYNLTADKIVMPERGQFPNGDAYYATLLHEIGHATGHQSRLNRDLSGGFGSENYAKEELRAEIASMIIGQELQIGYDPSQHHAYLQSWAKVIRNDPEEIIRAVEDAQKISDYVIGLARETEIIHEQLPESRTAWGNFPPVISNGFIGELKNEPEYLAAKSGDLEQAHMLVEKLLKDETINRIKTLIGNENPVIIPVLSKEELGRNRIPTATAHVLAENLNLTVDNNINQLTVAKRTGSGIYHRYISQPEFQGDVIKGNSYLIVDDTLSVGGTVASLKGYIENNGGTVIGAAVMSAYELENDITITENVLKSLQDKEGLNDYWLKEFGYGVDKLTKQEAGHLIKPTLEQIQQRISEARLALTREENGNEKDTTSEQRQIHPSVENERNGLAGTQGTEPEVSGVFQESNQETGSVQEYNRLEQQQQTNNRIYLYTSFKDLETLQNLKKQGIVKFDADHKVWYAHEKDQAAVAQWTSRPSIPTPEEAFSDHLKANGILVDSGHPKMDARPHRLANEGSKDKNVMYQFYDNNFPYGVPAARITNFSRSGESEKWVYPMEYLQQMQNMDKVDLLKYGQTTTIKPAPKLPEDNIQVKNLNQDQFARYDETAEKVKAAFTFLPVALSHEYLTRKGVTSNRVLRIVPDAGSLPDHLKDKIAIGNTWQEAKALRENNPDNKLVLQKGSLIVPQHNLEGELRSFETIGYKGAKYALQGAEKNGMVLQLGTIDRDTPFIVAEGYATGATLHEQLNKPVIITFGKNNLDVAMQLREKYPNNRIYFAADNDHRNEAEGKGNAGVEAASKAAAAIHGYVLVPQFTESDTGKDWNDVFVDKGRDEFIGQIKSQLNTVRSAEKKPESVTIVTTHNSNHPNKSVISTHFQKAADLDLGR